MEDDKKIIYLSKQTQTGEIECSKEGANEELLKTIKRFEPLYYELSNFHFDISKRLSDVDRQTVTHLNPMSAEGIRKLGKCRRLLNAFKGRLNEIQKLFDSVPNGFEEKLIALFRDDLIIPHDAVNALIIEKPIAPLPSNQWMSTILFLVESLEKELEELNEKTKINMV